jgi:hypothetical protein
VDKEGNESWPETAAADPVEKEASATTATGNN